VRLVSIWAAERASITAGYRRLPGAIEPDVGEPTGLAGAVDLTWWPRPNGTATG